MNQYISFWNWLVNKSSEIELLIKSGKSNSAASLISLEIDRIDSDLSWEIGINNDEVELTISAQGDKALGRKLDEMFAICPNIPGWKIYRYKQPKSLSILSELIRSQGYQLNVENINARVSMSPSNTKIDIELISQDFNQISHENLYEITFFIMDGVLGEEVVEEWIGKIDVNLVESKGEVLSLLDLPKFMKELVEGL